MINLSVADAQALVRKNLDELDPNGSIMYDDQNGSADAYGDNRSLDSLIARDLPEAINAVHKAAPVHLLEGVALVAETHIASSPAAAVSQDGVLSFTLKDDTKYLRLVVFQAADSGIVVTDAIPEASPEGRKQLNRHIRGRKDRPRLVILQGRHTGPSFRYYSIGTPSTYTSNPASAISQMAFVQEVEYASDTTTYAISRRLRQNIVDQLTAMVIETYGDQRSQAYYQKAMMYPSI